MPLRKTDPMDISRWLERHVGVQLLRLHDAIYRGTNGRIGHRIPGAPPSLLLHTTGAKTSQPRTTSLTYARDGDAYLIVASKGGDPRSPGWYHNQGQPGRRNQRRAQAIRCDSETGAAPRPGLRAALADRQREQRQPIHQLPEPDVTANPGRRIDPPLNLGASARRAGKFAGPYSYFVCRSSGSVKRPTSAILAAPG